MMLRKTLLNDWLQSLLHNRNISLPTSQPLYTYQLNEAEFFRLNSLLKQAPYSLQNSKDMGWCAAFCLYGAEWYRRKYMSGWSWSEIFFELGFDVDANKIADVVESGLTFWKRSISQYENGKRSFLGTVFSEGGVPFALLASEGSRFQLMFKKLLSDYDKAKAFGVSTVPFIQQQLERMANAFKQETTVKLLDDMVRKLYELIDGFSLDEQDQPAAFLDSKLPEWRKSFPIPLDDSTGEELLSGLLKSAANHRKATNEYRKRVQLEQWLANTEDLQFAASVELAKSFAIKIGKDHFSSPMVEVLICEGKQPLSRLGLVRAECRENETIVHLTKTLANFRRRQWETPLSIVLVQGGHERYRENIPHSALLLSEMPLVFEKKQDTHLFVGQGSFSKKASELWALIPENFQVLPLNNAELLESDNRGNCRFIGFVGELLITRQLGDDKDDFEISTKADQFSTDWLDIDGEEIGFESNNGYPVYKGFPRITCNYPDAEIYIGEQKIGQLEHLTGFFGRQILKVKVAGKTLYRKKIAILPASFSLYMQAGKAANQGSLHLACEQRMTSSVLSELSVTSKKTEDGKVFELACEGTPPAYVDVEIRANLLAEPIVLQVPFPTKGVLLFDGNGDKLPRKLVIDQLLGARAILFAQEGSSNTRFNLDLIAPYSSGHSVQESNNYRVRDSFQEVSLYEFRHKINAFLAATDDLDAVVRMVVSSPSCDSKQYEIGRYSVVPRKEGNTLVFNERDVKDFSDLKVELINLSDPNERPQLISQRTSNGAPIGKFELPMSLSSPSLAVPVKDSNISFRAIFIPATHSSLNTDQSKSLSKAVAEFHPKSNPRAFDHVFNEMSRDLAHSSWSYLDTLFSQYSYLPMVTFEVWKALAKQPGCLAAYLFATKHDLDDLMQSMQIELNVIWELLPAFAWKVAESRYREYLIVKGCPEDFLEMRVGKKKKDITRYLGLADLFEVKAQKGAMYFALIETWRSHLLRNKSDEGVIWPEYYAQDFNEWVMAYEPKLLCFDIPAKFQKAVLLFPIVAAAVVAGKATWYDVLNGAEPSNILIRQLMDFDRDWFESVFQSCLCVFSEE